MILNALFIGWYEAEVQSFDSDNDEIAILYAEEPEFVYRMPVVPSIVSGTLQLKQSLF